MHRGPSSQRKHDKHEAGNGTVLLEKCTSRWFFLRRLVRTVAPFGHPQFVLQSENTVRFLVAERLLGTILKRSQSSCCASGPRAGSPLTALG